MSYKNQCISRLLKYCEFGNNGINKEVVKEGRLTKQGQGMRLIWSSGSSYKDFHLRVVCSGDWLNATSGEPQYFVRMTNLNLKDNAPKGDTKFGVAFLLFAANSTPELFCFYFFSLCIFIHKPPNALQQVVIISFNSLG